MIGDPAAIAAGSGGPLRDQVAAMRPALLRFANQQLRNRQAAEDAVQEALIAILEHPHRFAGRSSLRTYVTGILKYKISDSLRYAYREPPDEQAEQQDELSEPLRLLQQAEFLKVLNQGLEKLSSNARDAFVLRECEGMEITELCQELAVTAANAWVLVHRARQRLRDHLQTHWLDPR